MKVPTPHVGWAASLLLAAAVLAGGCTHPCLELAERLCECSDTELEREACLASQRAAYEVADSDELAAQADTCAELIPVCDCQYLDTEEGKQACGLAR